MPQVEDSGDVFNIDKEFLNEAPTETPIEENPLLKQHNTADLFDKFSFVNEDNLRATTEAHTATQES